MPTVLHIAGLGCLIFAFTLLSRPAIRPSPLHYAIAITLDTACLTFITIVAIIWPAWWLLIPAALWTCALTAHICRYRDARVMVHVLNANRPQPGAPWRKRDPYGYGPGFEQYPNEGEDWRGT